MWLRCYSQFLNDLCDATPSLEGTGLVAALDRLQQNVISRELVVPEAPANPCKKEPVESDVKPTTEIIAGPMESINDLYTFGYPPDVKIGKFNLNAVTFSAAMRSIETFLSLRVLSNPKANTAASINIMAAPKKTSLQLDNVTSDLEFPFAGPVSAVPSRQGVSYLVAQVQDIEMFVNATAMTNDVFFSAWLARPVNKEEDATCEVSREHMQKAFDPETMAIIDAGDANMPSGALEFVLNYVSLKPKKSVIGMETIEMTYKVPDFFNKSKTLSGPRLTLASICEGFLGNHLPKTCFWLYHQTSIANRGKQITAHTEPKRGPTALKASRKEGTAPRTVAGSKRKAESDHRHILA